MPNRRAKEEDRRKAARELTNGMPGVDMDFKEAQAMQEQLYGSVSSSCGYSNCKTRGRPIDERTTLMQCSRCKGQKYCDSECQQADWPRHKMYCQSFSSTKVQVNKLRDKMALFLQLFMSFPEHVSDFILHIRELPAHERRGHCSIHFNNVKELEKWTKELQHQRFIELSTITARIFFYSKEKQTRLNDALGRTAVHREWVDRDQRIAFDKFLYDSLQWDDEEGILAQFRTSGVDLGQCGIILGISCIVNPADASQTNIMFPFCIKEPPIPAEDREPREITTLEVTTPWDDDCPTQ